MLHVVANQQRFMRSWRGCGVVLTHSCDDVFAPLEKRFAKPRDQMQQQKIVLGKSGPFAQDSTSSVVDSDHRYAFAQ